MRELIISFPLYIFFPTYLSFNETHSNDINDKCVTVGASSYLMYIISFKICYSMNLNVLYQIYNNFWEGILDKSFIVF